MEELVLKNDFYEWAYSDFLVNNQRGHLAEYIIAKALNTVSQKRLEWDPFDIKYKNLKIEVKSCAYIQAWEQKDFSKISFDNELQDCLSAGKVPNSSNVSGKLVSCLSAYLSPILRM